MKTALTILSLLPFIALADTQSSSLLHCVHDNKPLLVGESVWVVDPQLVKRTADHLRQRGYSEDAIAKEVERNDWVGFRLVCVNTFTVNTSIESKQPGDVLTPTGVALVLNEYSDDFYQHVVENQPPATPH